MTDKLNQTPGTAPAEPTQGARRATGVGSADAVCAPASLPASPPDPEVVERAQRRRFTAEYKRRILDEADHCATGELGALLRREGLYSSHLTTWRRQREAGALAALAPHKRGPKAELATPGQTRLRALERENAQLRERLAQAETIIEVQKKVSSLLGISLSSPQRGASG
jgi:transposase-like protein